MDGFTSIRRSIEHMKITVQKVIKGVRYLKHYGVKEFFIRLQETMESEMCRMSHGMSITRRRRRRCAVSGSSLLRGRGHPASASWCRSIVPMRHSCGR